jgi:hypothetical protein
LKFDIKPVADEKSSNHFIQVKASETEVLFKSIILKSPIFVVAWKQCILTTNLFSKAEKLSNFRCDKT